MFIFDRFFTVVIAISLSYVSVVQSEDCCDGIQTFIGPEIYHVHRSKEGGIHQHGMMYGARLGIDKIKRYKIYWGADVLWATGSLKGQQNAIKLHSHLTDINPEARLGYTFQSRCYPYYSLTPYLGVGYFWENNHYHSPSPLPVHLDNRFAYVPVGFLSQVYIHPKWSLGINFKIRILWDSEQKVSNDPYQDSFKQNYNEKLQYRVDIPITYLSFICLQPFYEYRGYGHAVNFPFDFSETTYQIYGATIKLQYNF